MTTLASIITFWNKKNPPTSCICYLSFIRQKFNNRQTMQANGRIRVIQRIEFLPLCPAKSRDFLLVCHGCNAASFVLLSAERRRPWNNVTDNHDVTWPGGRRRQEMTSFTISLMPLTVPMLLLASNIAGTTLTLWNVAPVHERRFCRYIWPTVNKKQLLPLWVNWTHYTLQKKRVKFYFHILGSEK